MYDTDFHSMDWRIRGTPDDFRLAASEPITIGNNVFIGTNTTILKGVSIGENAVIGACSLVTRDIPPSEIWGGVPAKFIKKIEI